MFEQLVRRVNLPAGVQAIQEALALIAARRLPEAITAFQTERDPWFETPEQLTGYYLTGEGLRYARAFTLAATRAPGRHYFSGVVDAETKAAWMAELASGPLARAWLNLWIKTPEEFGGGPVGEAKAEVEARALLLNKGLKIHEITPLVPEGVVPDAPQILRAIEGYLQQVGLQLSPDRRRTVRDAALTLLRAA